MRTTMLTLLDPVQTAAFYTAAYWRPHTIYGLVRDRAERASDKVAVREANRAVTYGELLDAADRLAATLEAGGIRSGQRVAVWLPSCSETAAIVLACSRNRYVCSPSLHRDHTVAEVAELLRRMRAAALVAGIGFGADGDRHNIFSEASGVDTLRVTLPLPCGDVRTALLPELTIRSAADPVSQPDTVFYLAFTSGTTGQPKGVMHSDNTVLAPVRALAAEWQLDAESVIYSLSPLSHNLGFGAMILALTQGSELVVHDLPRGASVVDRIVQTGATFLFGVPTHAVDLLAELKDRELTQVGSVRGFRISGASVPARVVRGLLDHGVIPQSGYGMTEAGSHHFTRRDDPAELIVDSSGRAYDGYEVRIFSREDCDSEVLTGELGQIGGRGAGLMLGYFDDQTATEESFNSTGWFLTGDLGWMDEAGNLRVTGRKKDIIIRGGHNILPAKIEMLALRHDAVDKVAAVPVPDERLGERVCLVVTLRTGAGLEPGALLDHLDAVGLSRYDMPEYFLQIKEFPLLPSGKIFKQRLLDWIGSGRVNPVPVRFSPRSAHAGGTR